MLISKTFLDRLCPVTNTISDFVVQDSGLQSLVFSLCTHQVPVNGLAARKDPRSLQRLPRRDRAPTRCRCPGIRVLCVVAHDHLAIDLLLLSLSPTVHLRHLLEKSSTAYSVLQYTYCTSIFQSPSVVRNVSIFLHPISFSTLIATLLTFQTTQHDHGVDFRPFKVLTS